MKSFENQMFWYHRKTVTYMSNTTCATNWQGSVYSTGSLSTTLNCLKSFYCSVFSFYIVFWALLWVLFYAFVSLFSTFELNISFRSWNNTAYNIMLIKWNCILENSSKIYWMSIFEGFSTIDNPIMFNNYPSKGILI